MISQQKESFKYISTDILSSVLVVLLMFGTSIQYEITTLFGIGFNLFYIQLVIFVTYLICAKCRILLQKKAAVFLFVVVLIFVLNNAFNSSLYCSDFTSQFITSCILIPVCFCFYINYDLVFRFSGYASVLTCVMAMILICTNKVSSSDYMVFGFYFFQGISFLLISFASQRKWIYFGISCVMIPICLVYSSKTCWYMFAILLVIILYWFSPKLRYKIGGTIGIVAFFFGYKKVLTWLIQFLLTHTSFNSYSLRTLQMILDGTLTALGDRQRIFELTLSQIKIHPILGMGIGGFGSDSAIYPHNFFLDVWVTFGVFFGSAIILYLIYSVFKALKGNRGYRCYYILLVWCLVNFMRLMTTHTFVCEPIFYLLFCFAINEIEESRRECKC